MNYLSLFRKYRSQDFSEIVGQEHITRTLKNALENKRLSSAYLFCGPRGTGKTTLARIFAKCLNCEKGVTTEPCKKCSMCHQISLGSSLDVIEIDAASHTQVEKIREFIIQKVDFAPTQGRYKVYIIDEAHKLSDSSFNALLKTLEEPPPHTVFILATTHPDELLPTVLSRCQRYDFRRIPIDKIISHLRWISEKESIAIEDGAVNLIAQTAEGSLRDALVILEQIALYSGNKIETQDIIDLLGITESDRLFEMSENLAQKDTLKSIELIINLINQGVSLEQFTKDIVEYYRQLLLIKTGAKEELVRKIGSDTVNRISEQSLKYSLPDIIRALKILIDLRREIKDYNIASTMWEIAIVKLTKPHLEPSLEVISHRLSALEKELEIKKESEEKSHKIRIFKEKKEEQKFIKTDLKEEEKIPPAEKQKKSETEKDKLPDENIEEKETEKVEQVKELEEKEELVLLWNKIMQTVKKEKMSLHALLLEAKPISLEKDCLKLGFRYDFHKSNVIENKIQLEKIIEKVISKPIKIDCIMAKQETIQENKDNYKLLVEEALNLFEGEVVN